MTFIKLTWKIIKRQCNVEKRSPHDNPLDSADGNNNSSEMLAHIEVYMICDFVPETER